MSKYKNIEHMLKTVFSCDFGLSEEQSKSLYLQAIQRYRDTYELELEEAFSDENISWKRMLNNPENEVYDAESESVAVCYARKILYEPVFGKNK